MKIWILFFFLLLISGMDQIFAKEQALSGVWSLRALARASNAVLVIVDESLEKKPQIMCNLKDQEVRKLSLNLKMIIDEKIRGLTVAQIENVLRDGKNCEIECACDIYVLAMEAFPENKKMKESLIEIQKKAKSMSSTDRKRCAESYQEFCQTRLLRTIRK